MIPHYELLISFALCRARTAVADGHLTEASIQQGIHQTGRASANVDDLRGGYGLALGQSGPGRSLEMSQTN